MKKIIFFFAILFLCTTAFSQYDTTPPYLKTKVVPNFLLLSIDSVAFTQTVLTENKNTIIMLFNPDCGHCQEQLELLLTLPEVTKTTSLILATTEPLKKIKNFYDKYQLQKYPWIHIGKDPKYFFGVYYKPKTIPVLAFYNKQKQFVYFSQGNVKKKEIIKALKK
jgi:thiol-disulfide isomerase/thioredoxin